MQKFINNLTEDEKKNRFLKNIHSIDAQKKVSNKMKEWSSIPENLKKRGESISRVKKLPENFDKISYIMKKNWESEEYRKKVFSKPQKLTFNQFLFDKFINSFKERNNVITSTRF